MTIMEDAKNGIITPLIKEVAAKESIDPKIVCSCIAKGIAVIPYNQIRDSEVMAIGKYMSTKINANIGTSRDYINIDEEIQKALTAEKFGADAIMDLSTGGDLDHIRKSIIKSVNLCIGSVPIYQAAASKKFIIDMTSDDMFNIVRKHAADGVDFVTIHAGVNLETLEKIKKGNRITEVVSRGGSFTFAWMLHNEENNPYYKEYDYLLEIAHEYDIAISLGDGMRPGSIHDAGDSAMFTEIVTLGELVKKSRDANVQSFVEGPGHVPADEIEHSVKTMKSLCHDAPVYLLGPLVTDIAPGYDHITAAIGGTIAGMYGADFLCMTTPSEHLGLPTIEDIKEGTVVTKIAAHAVDITKIGQKEKACEVDNKMSYARQNLNWEDQYKLAIDGEKARNIRESRINNSGTCSMCGDLCAMKIVSDNLSKK